jgi:hypothetical protein
MDFEPENEAAEAATNAGLLADLYGDGEEGPENANGPHSCDEARPEGNCASAEAQARVYAKSPDGSSGNAGVSALRAAELRAALAAVKAAPRGRRDMRRLAVAYEAVGETPVWLRPWNPEIAAIPITAETPAKIKNLVKSNGKTPVKDDFYNDATNGSSAYDRFTDPKTGGSVQGNIGLANYAKRPNGKRGLKIDIDTKKSGGAEKATRAERIKHLEDKYGPIGRTVMSLSVTPPDLAPEPGGHLHTEVEDGLDIILGRHPINGVDCPQQVLAPGSEIGGRFYDFMPGHAPWDDVGHAPAPRALVDYMTRGSSAFDKAKGEAKVADGVELDQESNISRALDWILNHAPEAVEGEGKHKTAAFVIQKIRDHATSREMTLRLADIWSRLKCTPPYEIERLRKLVFTLDPSRQTEVGSNTPEGVFGPADDGGEETAKPKLKFRSVRDCVEATRTFKETPLVKGLLDLGATSILFAPPNEGKSFVAVSLAYAVATGASWAERPVTRGAVVFVAYEGRRRFPQRIAALAKRYGLEGDAPLYLVDPPKMSLYSPGWREELLSVIA